MYVSRRNVLFSIYNTFVLVFVLVLDLNLDLNQRRAAPPNLNLVLVLVLNLNLRRSRPLRLMAGTMSQSVVNPGRNGQKSRFVGCRRCFG